MVRLQGKGLIVPDVHERIIKLKRILARYEPEVDWVLFLGDYLDTFAYGGLPSQDTKYMCEWIIENQDNPKHHRLFGNHDLHYAYAADPLKCSGWNRPKQTFISEHLKPNHWKKFHLIAWIIPPGSENEGSRIGPRKWLCSHAGIHPLLLHPVYGFDPDVMEKMEQKVFEQLTAGRVDPWLQAGRGRGGSQIVGGVDWLDWGREFIPINGLNQIVGHTVGEIPRIKENAESFNVCIDTNSRHVILVDAEGKIDLRDVMEDCQ